MISKEVKVGVFVLAGLVMFGVVIFLIGDSRRMFESRATYHTVFEDVQGLGRGSPVRMGGLDVGSVAGVRYSDDPKDNRLFVELSIVADEAVRIREDSRATIAGKGFLGDKMVVITPGEPGRPGLDPGSTIPSNTPQDMSLLMDQLAGLGAKAEKVMGNLERTTQSLASDTFREDLQASAAALRKILDSAASGDGYVHRVLTDPKEADRLSATVANLEQVTAELDQFARVLTGVINRVQDGPGLAHELIYGDPASAPLKSIGFAAEEAGLLLKTIREQGGDRNLAQLLADLEAVGADLRTVTAGLREGKGTLGALLTDPSVYEDVKVLLGNVQRNEALRALVRYSIKQDERGAPASVSDPGAGGP